MAKALRIAAWNNGAPKRCRRRDCRSQNRCHINVASDGKSSCPGGFSDKAMEEAALMMLFAMSLLNPETLKF